MTKKMIDAEIWLPIAESIKTVLPKIDRALSDANTPLSKRKARALDFIQSHMIEIQGDYQEFLNSEAYARIMALVDDWYCERYGAALEADKDRFHSLVVIHGTAFPLLVPSTFSIPGEEDGTVWVGFPASVQKEEDPLSWIVDSPNFGTLPESDYEALRKAAEKTATAIRSIIFDLRTLQSYTVDTHRDLAASVLANLRSSAQKLCGRDDGLLRDAGWELCQAVEKALKLYIRRNGGQPKTSHKLAELADHAEMIGTIKIDRRKIDLVPSDKAAVNLRYEGRYSIEEGLEAYSASLDIIQALAFEARVKSEFDVRQARFLFKTPPWFSYDTDSFLAEIKIAGSKK